MLKTLLHYAENDFVLHAYVVMPDHLHLLVTPSESLEKAVQLIKGGFSFRAKRELDWRFDIWQPGFTDHRVRNEEDWNRHLEYIRRNPIEARLVDDSVVYEFMGFPNIAFPQGLKPHSLTDVDVRPEGRTLQSNHAVDVRAEARTLHSVRETGASETVKGSSFSLSTVKGTGFSPSVKAASFAGALAPEGMKGGSK